MSKRFVGTRIMCLCILLTMSLFLGITEVTAQDFPDKPINLIIPFGAGGASDIISRGITGKAANFLGQPVVIHIVPGGGGAIGTDQVARANPDGYTLLFGHTNCNTILPLMEGRSKGPGELTPVCQINVLGGIMVTQPDAPFKTAQEMISWAENHPGELIFGTVGTWSITDFSWKEIVTNHNIKTRSVTYTGGGEALTAMLGGHIMVSALAGPQTLKHIAAGKLRPLVVFGEKRSPALPDVPTQYEAGLKTSIGSVWQGVLAPKGTPSVIVDKLANAFKQMTETPEATDMLKKFSDEFDFLGPDEFGKAWQAEYNTYKGLKQKLSK